VVHVDPIKPMSKPPGTVRLKLKCDELLSSFAFKVNLRRYMMVRNYPNVLQLRLRMPIDGGALTVCS